MNYARVLAEKLAPPASMPFNYKNLQTRFDSFGRLGALMADEKRNLAHHGMYYDGAARAYRCAYCPAAMDKCCARSIKYHKFSAHCPRSAELLRTNRALRRFSFTAFKAARSRYEKRRDELADDGFYFDATSLSVRCSGCGMAIERLCKADNVRAVHGLYSPMCAFVHGAARTPPPTAAPRRAPMDVSREPEKSPDYTAERAPSAPVIDEDDDELARVVSRLLTIRDGGGKAKQQPGAASSPRYLTAAMQALQIVERSKSLYPNLNVERSASDVDADASAPAEKPTPPATEDRLCKICFERERQICFAPCGHLSTCERCAKRCVRCCICRKPVKDKIRVFV